MKEKILNFIKKEIVFLTAAVVALISAIFVPPSKAYIGYINFSVLGLLFALMGVVAGFSRLGVLKRAAEIMIEHSAARGQRVLVFVLWTLCFFGAMLITNDVALITFVPLSITLFTMLGCEEYIITTVVLQTAAANLGSMMTPMGNPQNLFLYDTFALSLADFFKITLPYGALSFLLLFAANMLLIKNKPLSIENGEKTQIGDKKKLVMYAALGVLCLLSVGKLLDYRITVAATAVCMLIFDRHTLKNIDWFLLLTFLMFFVFVGNIASVDSIKTQISQIIEGREVLSAVLLSQVISNMPCATMLSSFTDNGAALVVGTNIGGLGTLVASLASLISFKLYCAMTPKADKKAYIFKFSALSVIFLLILLLFYGIIS